MMGGVYLFYVVEKMMKILIHRKKVGALKSVALADQILKFSKSTIADEEEAGHLERSSDHTVLQLSNSRVHWLFEDARAESRAKHRNANQKLAKC